MSKLEEYQKELGKIENKEGYVYLEDTLCSYRSLVEDMLETIRELEESKVEKSRLMKLELEASAKRH